MTEMIAESRILLNANYIVSTWVYLDDLDTSKNVLYVSVLFSYFIRTLLTSLGSG